MKNIFLDTNVLIDFLADRKPFSIHAAQLFDSSERKKVRLFISAVSYNNIYYILKQRLSHQQTIRVLNSLHEWTHTIDVTGKIIDSALKSDFSDFEDAIQHSCAKSIPQIGMIVTRDTKDFRKSDVAVANPAEAISIIGDQAKQ